MAKQLNDSGTAAQFDWEIRRQAREVAREQGWDEIPMTREDFPFYRWTHFYVESFKKKRNRGGSLDDTVAAVLSRVMVQTKLSGRKLFEFPGWLEEHPGKGFDDFFQACVSYATRLQVDRRENTKTMQRAEPILNGPESEWGYKGLPEADLFGDYLEAPNVLVRQEEERFVKDEFPAWLATQARGRLLVYVWEAMREKKELKRTADELNLMAEDDSAYATPRNKLWSASTVGRLQDDLVTMARERQGRKFRSGSKIVFQRIVRPSLQVRM